MIIKKLFDGMPLMKRQYWGNQRDEENDFILKTNLS